MKGLNNALEDFGVIGDAMGTLRSLKGAFRTLNDLLKSLTASIITLESTILPFQLEKGLYTLPDDILSMIFQFVGDRKTLFLVSRRLLEVASKVPQLWGKVSNRNSEKELKECLTRSGTTGLDVDFSVDDFRRIDPLVMFDTVLPHSARWRSLEMSVGNSWAHADGVLTTIGQRCRDAVFTQLSSMSIEFPSSFDDDPNEDDGDGDVDPTIFEVTNSSLHFFESIKLPVLSSLHVVNLIPNPFPAPKLRSLWIELLRRPTQSERSPANIVRLLSALPHLEELHLSLAEELKQEEIPAVSLPNLKTFKLDVVHWLLDAKDLMKALTLPVIRIMHINIEQHRSDKFLGLTTWLKALFCHDKYPTLEELFLEFADLNCEQKKKYDIPFEKFPNLRTLCLDTPELHPDYSKDDLANEQSLPSLRTLHIKESDCALAYWLGTVGPKLAGQGWGGRDNFGWMREGLEGSLETGLVKNLCAGKRIVWEKSDPDRFTAF